MKDMIRERLIMLASAKERMIEIEDKMELWDIFQLTSEKSMFETMNAADKVLNLSDQGKQLVDQLQTNYNEQDTSMTVSAYDITSFLKELQRIFNEISLASVQINERLHRFEGDVACQKHAEEELRQQMEKIGECLDSAVACAEMVMAEM